MSRSDTSVDADFRVLGPLRVVADGKEIEIATRRQRALLVLLLMNVGRVVSAERLIDQLWDGAPPPQATVTLRSYISNLRQSLGGKDGLGGSLTTRGQGYSLEVPPESIDAFRLRQLTERGRQHLRDGRAGQALADLTAAVDAWAGDPLTEIADHEAAQSSITQLTETYLGAVEARFEALLANGLHLDAIPGLEAFASDHPLREEPRALLMLALYRAGRAPEALEVHRRFRTLLQDELGIDPTPRLDQLVQAILEQDDALDGPAAPTRSSGGPGRAAVSLEPVDAQATRARPASQVVGRGAETERLHAHLTELVRSRAGSLVLLAGEPGIGKTTMLELVEEHATALGAQVHAGRSPASAGAPAFWPWTQVLESIAATMDEETLARATAGAARSVAQLSPSIAERTGRHVPLTGDSPQALRFVMYEAVSAFLRQSDNQPMVITLDDLQWADLPSLELLSYLTPTLETRPLLLVTAYRNLPADRSDALEATLATVFREDAAHEVALGGLAQEDIAAFTQDLFSTDQSSADQERLASVLHQRTGGNPFFVRQLARLIMETDVEPDVAALAVPPGVGHVIAQRVNGLSDAGKEFLSAAAVVGREFDLRLAAAAASMDPEIALDAFDEAARHGLVEPATSSGEKPHFVHALVQEVLLERLAAGRSARLHARVADEYGLTSGVAPGNLAEHLWAAREVVGARAIPAQLAAAEASAALFSYGQAEVYLRRALHLVRTATEHDPHTELMVLLSLFRLIAIDRGWGDEDASEVVKQATALTEAGALADDTARLWWSLFFSMLDRDDTEGYVQVARTLSTTLANRSDEPSAGDADAEPAKPLGQAARAAVHVMTVFERLAAGDEEGAEQQLRYARERVEAADPTELAAYDEHLHVMLLLMEGYWSAIIGDAEANRSATSAAIALADADGRPFPRAIARTLAVAGLPYLDDPLAEDAVARVTEALEFANRFGFGWLAWSSSAFHAWADALDGGDATEAARSIETFIEDLRSAKRYGNLSITFLQLADVYLVLGRTDDARDALREAQARPGPYRSLVMRTYQRRLELLA